MIQSHVLSHHSVAQILPQLNSNLFSEVHSKPCQIFKIERFAKIVYVFRSTAKKIPQGFDFVST